MAKGSKDKPLIDFHVRTRRRGGQKLRVVEVLYVPTQDAEERLIKAFNILLAPSAVSNRELDSAADAFVRHKPLGAKSAWLRSDIQSVLEYDKRREW